MSRDLFFISTNCGIRVFENYVSRQAMNTAFNHLGSIRPHSTHRRLVKQRRPLRINTNSQQRRQGLSLPLP